MARECATVRIGDARRGYVACYRQGLREVLSSAISWGEELLGGSPGDEAEGSQ